MIAHWDEVASGRGEAGHIAGLWTDLGSAAGTKTVGVARSRWASAARSRRPPTTGARLLARRVVVEAVTAARLWEREVAAGELELPEAAQRVKENRG